MIKELNKVCKNLSPNNSTIGKKLIKAGILLLVFPEPFVSHLIGSMLLAAGMSFEKLRGPSISELGIRYRDSLRLIEEFRRDLMGMSKHF